MILYKCTQEVIQQLKYSPVRSRTAGMIVLTLTVYIHAKFFIWAVHNTLVDIHHMLKGGLLLSMSKLMGRNMNCRSKSTNIIVIKMQLELSCWYAWMILSVLDEAIKQGYENN